MAEEQVVQTRTPGDGNGAPVVPTPVVATRERTGEGEVYYTGPRPAAAPAGAVVAPTFRDRIRWQSIVGGIITALTAMAVLSMLGVAIGFMVFGPGSSAGTIGLAVGIWAACSAFLSFIIGGWAAGKTAGVGTAGNAMLNGFLVGGTVLVIILWAAAAGVGNIFGLIGGSAGELIHLGISDPNGLRSALGGAGSAAGNSGVTAGQVLAQASTAAWYVFASTVIGLIAATLGGWLGWLTRLPGEYGIGR
jgi:hypothetical protein